MNREEEKEQELLEAVTRYIDLGVELDKLRKQKGELKPPPKPISCTSLRELSKWQRSDRKIKHQADLLEIQINDDRTEQEILKKKLVALIQVKNVGNYPLTYSRREDESIDSL